MSQTRFYIFRFTAPSGQFSTLCTTNREEWNKLIDEGVPEDGWSLWLTPWDNSKGHGQEATWKDHRLARVNFAHIMSVEFWSVLR